MSRSGYSDDYEGWHTIMWRGAVLSAIRGKRGQAFLREMLAALDVMPEKRLISDALIEDGEVCALGSVGRARGIDMSKLDPEAYCQLSKIFGISEALIREIEYENDEDYCSTPEDRWQRVRAWVIDSILPNNNGEQQ